MAARRAPADRFGDYSPTGTSRTIEKRGGPGAPGPPLTGWVDGPPSFPVPFSSDEPARSLSPRSEVQLVLGVPHGVDEDHEIVQPPLRVVDEVAVHDGAVEPELLEGPDRALLLLDHLGHDVPQGRLLGQVADFAQHRRSQTPESIVRGDLDPDRSDPLF